MANHLYEKQKIGSAYKAEPARRANVAQYSGPPIRFNLVKARKSEHARTLLARAKGSSLSTPANGDSAERVTLLPGRGFLQSIYTGLSGHVLSLLLLFLRMEM